MNQSKSKGSLSVLAAAGLLGLCMVAASAIGQSPASGSVPKVGQKAPAFTLSDQDGKPVSLASLLSSAATAPSGGTAHKPGGVLVFFYRGYW